MSFSLKTLEIAVTLAEGASRGGDTLTIRGLPADVTIEKAGLPDLNSADVTITGMAIEDMERLTTLSFAPEENLRNVIRISAAEGDETPRAVFTGEITSAYADFGAAPDPAFKITAATGSYPNMMFSAPLSVKGQARLSDLVASFAAEMGYSFINEGVEASVKDAVFRGSPLQKAIAAAEEAEADLLVDEMTLILLKKDAPRPGEPVLVSAETGMMGYPAFGGSGVSFKCAYNPALKLRGLVRIESVVPKASGVWRITKLTHGLSAFKTSGGSWETSAEASPE